MKILGKTITVVLLLIMLAGSFTGCFTMWAMKEGGEAAIMIFFPPLFPALDIITSPIQLIIFAVEMSQQKELREKASSFDQIDSFSANLSLIPGAELFSLTEKLNSLPESEIIIFTETVNSFSEAEISAITRTFNNLSEAEIISSMEILNSLPDEMLIAALNNIKHIEFLRYE